MHVTAAFEGGAVESIWRFDGSHEAVPLTAEWRGTSSAPMFRYRP